MPRRERRDKRRRLELMPRTHVALTCGPVAHLPGVEPDPSEALLGALWFEHREKLLGEAPNVATLWAFWAFEDVPDELRAERPQQRCALDDPEAEARATLRCREDEEALERRRASWLERSGTA